VDYTRAGALDTSAATRPVPRRVHSRLPAFASSSASSTAEAILAYNDIAQSTRSVARREHDYFAAVRCSTASGTPIGDAIAGQVGPRARDGTVTCIGPSQRLEELRRRASRPVNDHNVTWSYRSRCEALGGLWRSTPPASSRSDRRAGHRQERPDRAQERGQALRSSSSCSSPCSPRPASSSMSRAPGPRSDRSRRSPMRPSPAHREAGGLARRSSTREARRSPTASGFRGRGQYPPKTGNTVQVAPVTNDCTSQRLPTWSGRHHRPRTSASVIGQGSWDVGARCGRRRHRQLDQQRGADHVQRRPSVTAGPAVLHRSSSARRRFPAREPVQLTTVCITGSNCSVNANDVGHHRRRHVRRPCARMAWARTAGQHTAARPRGRLCRWGRVPVVINGGGHHARLLDVDL
jgi:hypothetical protein